MSAGQRVLELDDVIFQTRTLAQSHPFTASAYRYVNHIVARERMNQPVTEVGIWAGYALTAGYCLRRVEEDDTDSVPVAVGETDTDELDRLATDLAARLRTEGAEHFLLYDEDRVIQALDRLIAGEIDRRLGHWAGSIEDEAWAEISEYLAWWVVKGYALRVAEVELASGVSG